MNENKIIYDSDEILGIVSKIGETINTMQSDVYPLLNNGFSLLEELDLFNTGLEKLKAKTDNSIYINNKLITCLRGHDNDLNELDNKHKSLFSNISASIDNNNYSGAAVEINDIVLNKINDGKVILTEYVKEVIPSFSYDKKLEVLKDILSNDSNSLSLLTDVTESDIMVYKLKEVLNKEYSIELNKLTKEEEQEIQKSFFESIIDNDTNIFDDIDGNSFLHGLHYYKQIADKNDISVSDLIYNDENKELFMEAVNDIYNNEEVDVLTEKETISVKNYIKEIASKNSIGISEMLSDSKYSSVIKGGIYYED